MIRITDEDSVCPKVVAKTVIATLQKSHKSVNLHISLIRIGNRWIMPKVRNSLIYVLYIIFLVLGLVADRGLSS